MDLPLNKPENEPAENSSNELPLAAAVPDEQNSSAASPLPTTPRPALQEMENDNFEVDATKTLVEILHQMALNALDKSLGTASSDAKTSDSDKDNELNKPGL